MRLSVLASLQGITAWVGDVIYSFFVPLLKEASWLFGEANPSLRTTRRCGCERVSRAGSRVTLAWGAVLVPGSADGAFAIPASSGDADPCPE